MLGRGGAILIEIFLAFPRVGIISLRLFLLVIVSMGEGRREDSFCHLFFLPSRYKLLSKRKKDERRKKIKFKVTVFGSVDLCFFLLR